MSAQKMSIPATGTYYLKTDLSKMKYGAGIGLGVFVPAGVTISYTVNLSFSDPTLNPTDWFPHDTLGTTQGASATGNVAFPVQWVGVAVTSLSGGSATFYINQAD